MSDWRQFLGLRRSILGLLGMVVLVGLGERLAERFLPIYVDALGGGEWAIGALNTLTVLLGALYAYPGGWLSDRLGTKRALVVFNLMAMAGYLVVIFVPSWVAVLGASCLFLSWSAISLPASMSLISKVLPKDKRTMGVAVHSFVRRIPMALGPVVGGTLIVRFGEQGGVRLAFIGAFVLAAVALVLQQKLIEEDPGKPKEGVPVWDATLISPHLRVLLASDILIRFCEQMPYAFVVIWCMRRHGLDAEQFGLLTAVEMATAALIYVPVAWLADRGHKKPFVVATFVFFTLFPVTLLHCATFWPLVGAFVLRGLKEFGEPTRKALIMDLAPEGRKAAAFGMYYLARDLTVSLSVVAGAWLWTRDPALCLWAATACGVLGTAVFAVLGRDLSGLKEAAA